MTTPYNEEAKIISLDIAKEKQHSEGVKPYYKTYTNVKGVAKMDQDKILEIYISKVDKDQSELKKDIREREERTERHIRESEDRMDRRLQEIEALIEIQNNNLNDIVELQNDKMDYIKEKVETGLKENKNFMWGIVITILLSIIATIGVIVSTYFSTISLLKDMIVK